MFLNSILPLNTLEVILVAYCWVYDIVSILEGFFMITNILLAASNALSLS